jgi:hypothetical protein
MVATFERGALFQFIVKLCRLRMVVRRLRRTIGKGALLSVRRDHRVKAGHRSAIKTGEFHVHRGALNVSLFRPYLRRRRWNVRRSFPAVLAARETFPCDRARRLMR